MSKMNKLIKESQDNKKHLVTPMERLKATTLQIVQPLFRY